MLFIISLVMGIINAYFPVERLRNFLSRNKLYGLEYLLASVSGAITPFCSCSSVPLFIGFVQGGIPLGVTFSFLITSPLVNEVALALFIGMFGWKITLILRLIGNTSR
ncbi:MAG: permease [Owenweeksia sp.]|nr:permease [Owenweeksia sp.]